MDKREGQRCLLCFVCVRACARRFKDKASIGDQEIQERGNQWVQVCVCMPKCFWRDMFYEPERDPLQYCSTFSTQLEPDVFCLSVWVYACVYVTCLCLWLCVSISLSPCLSLCLFVDLSLCVFARARIWSRWLMLFSNCHRRSE